MNPAWQLFLEQQAVQHLGATMTELSADRDRTVLCDLGQFGILKVSGDEAQIFLQNLLSSDVQEVNLQHAQLSSLNNPKGRMLSSFLVWHAAGDYFLQLPISLCSAISKRLSMYILRAKVKIEDISAQQVCMGLSGNDATALLQQHFGTVPQDVWAVGQHDRTTLIRVGTQRFQLITSPEQASALWQTLSLGAQPVNAACWDWLNIHAGIPVILPATQEQFVPQMVNLELIGGVNFKKGCYPGQEIVARMQYLGKLKRRMVLAHIAQEKIQGDAAPQAGDELYSAEMNGQASGMIVNASAAPGGGHDVLAVVQISDLENKAVHWKSAQGATLQFLPLPYALTP